MSGFLVFMLEGVHSADNVFVLNVKLLAACLEACTKV